MREIRVYFEGDKRLRLGFHAFLDQIVQLARRRRINLHLIAGGSQAIQDFIDALETHPSAFVLLLVDSEGPAPKKPLDAVRGRDDWRPSRTVGDDEVHLMVQAMETWFLADQEVLDEYYGQGFRAGRLPPNPHIEAIPKVDVLEGLKQATRETQKGEYHKTRHAPDILAKISAAKVRGVAPACERLFSTLQRVIGEG